MEDAASSKASDDAGLEQQSQPYIGRWNQLISSTNWEKGRIIFEWREALVDAEAPAAEYSDEAWASRVGGVTPQHVGRLRRVFHRFGETFESYTSIYWSHFLAALDWDDAEMWLEGAVQSKWSVSQMRSKRHETLGEAAPKDDVVAAELDEDALPAGGEDAPPVTLSGDFEGVQGPRPDGPDFGDSDDAPAVFEDNEYEPLEPTEGVDLVQPFADLPDLPEDLADACDAFKLAILAHKADGWQQVPRDAVLATLDGLKALATAPSSDDAPF